MSHVNTADYALIQCSSVCPIRLSTILHVSVHLQCAMSSQSVRRPGDQDEKQPLLDGSSEPDDTPPVERASNVRRKSSTAKQVIERMVRTRERLWAVTVSSTIAAIPALLVGFTIGYPSPVLLDLQGDSVQENQRFNALMADLFGVSLTIITVTPLQPPPPPPPPLV